MDHKFVLSYDYSNRNRRRGQTNAPPLRAIFMVIVVSRCHTDFISQCSMTRALLEATGCHHWATIRSVLPWRPPGRQQMKRRCNVYQLCWPFRWPWQCGGTILRASPNGGGSWLSQKPLHPTIGIGRALAPMLQNRTHYAGCFGHLIVKKSSI